MTASRACAMTRKRRVCIPDIHVTPHSFEVSKEHVRTALHLLSELDERLGGTGSGTRERYHAVRLLAAARRQLWLAAAALDSGADGSEWGVPRRTRKRRWVLGIVRTFGALGALVVGFIFACVSRYMRAVLRVLLRG
jgi:hypothetical protein